MAKKGQPRILCKWCGKEIYWDSTTAGWRHVKERTDKDHDAGYPS